MRTRFGGFFGKQKSEDFFARRKEKEKGCILRRSSTNERSEFVKMRVIPHRTQTNLFFLLPNFQGIASIFHLFHFS